MDKAKDEAIRLLSDKKCDLSFEDFVRKHSGMSPRPGFYAGRGPCTNDLSDRHLEQLYEGLKTEVGDEAARNFVMMVEDLEDLSAAAFLWSFIRYWESKRWTNQQPQKNDGVTISGYGEDAFFEAEACVLNVLSDRRNLDEQKEKSHSIKRAFLLRHSVRQTVYRDVFGSYHRDDFDHPYSKRRWY